jgi:endoglucanase
MRPRLLLPWVVVLAALVALAAPAIGQRPEPGKQRPPGPGGGSGDVPASTRFCGQGGDPSKPGNGTDPKGVKKGSPNPLRGLDLYVNKIQDQAYQDMKAYERRGQTTKAKYMANIANRPRGVWFGRFTRPNFRAKVQNFINCAQYMQPGSVPTMVVLRAQSSQCNSSYTGGGKAEDARTRKWYRDFKEAVGDARVIIAFEPDSIGTISCLKASRRASRRALLKYGVSQMAKIPNATVYLEATASDWKSPSYSASLLKAMGVNKVRGFMVNVTHFDWTINNIRYGRKISKKIGGKPFMVSTSYNGRGPVHYKARNGRRINVFCNVRYRGVGPAPTTSTGYKNVDAFLYLNRPGISGAGSCNGAPANGAWWPARALMFGKYATSWVRPPRGTRFGFKNPPSLCKLGAPGPDGRYFTSAPERRCR